MLVLDAPPHSTPRPTPRTGIPRLDRSAVILGVIAMAVGTAGSWIPSYWGDEAASVMSATRSWSSLGAMLVQIDGVHGFYYALLHLWAGMFGTSEFATRFPSAIAVGLMVAGTVVMTRQFADRRVAIVAGIVCIVLPRTTYMATETRSYALGAALAVWATVLFIRLARSEGRRREWVGYAVVMAVAMYVFLYLGLLLIVHAVFLSIVHRRVLRRWAGAAVAALLLASPILAAGVLERQQISFLARRNYATAGNILTNQWFGYLVLAIICWLLILLAVGAAAVRGRRAPDVTDGRVSLTLLCLVWLAIPTALLLTINATLLPVYNDRYLSFCVPAAAILVALGIGAVASFAGAHRRSLVTAVLVGGIVLACVPAYLYQRTAWAKDDGSDLRAVAEYVQRNATTGGVVVFDQTAKPSRDPRLGLDLYPQDFSALQDVALQTPFADRAGLWDSVAPTAELTPRLNGISDVWAIELAVDGAPPADIVQLESVGYRVQSAQLIHRTTVYHLVRQ